MGLRGRRRSLPLVLCAFAASFLVVLAAIVVIRHYHSQRAPALIVTGHSGYVTPASLDRQWITYSDESTCADRAGGDGVSAVRLSPAQIAWFFSDSSLGPASPRTGLSEQSGFVHNLVVMQTVDGSASKLITITGGNACAGPGRPGHARSVVRPGIAGGPENQRYWTGDGMRIGARVLHFYSRYLPGALVPTATVIASFAVSQLASDAQGPPYGEVITPSVTRLPSYVPPGGGTPIVWGASMRRAGGTIYLYGWQEPRLGPFSIRLYLAKVAVSRLSDFTSWRFSAGNGRWAAGQANARPLPVSAGLIVDTEFSVIRAAGRYWLIEAAGGFGGTDIDAYPGRAPWGPFQVGGALVLYHATGIGLSAADDYDVMYDAMAEPSISAPHSLLISYNVNSVAVTSGCVPLSAYTNAVIQPRFVSVPMADFGAPRVTARPLAAVAGRSANPFSTSKHQPRWYDSLSYPGGCPPLPAVSDLTASDAHDSANVRWHEVGPGVRYRVFLRTAGGKYVLVRIVRKTSVTLSGLAPGTRYQVLVIPENSRHRDGPGARVSFRSGAAGTNEVPFVASYVEEH
jgi:Fibronectin type III domain